MQRPLKWIIVGPLASGPTMPASTIKKFHCMSNEMTWTECVFLFYWCYLEAFFSFNWREILIIGEVKGKFNSIYEHLLSKLEQKEASSKSVRHPLKSPSLILHINWCLGNNLNILSRINKMSYFLDLPVKKE